MLTLKYGLDWRFFHLQCLGLQFSDELSVILGKFRTVRQRLEGGPSPENTCHCWASPLLPGEGPWISHCFVFLRSSPGKRPQWRSGPGPGMSKMSLVGDTGRSTRQPGSSCCLLCLMFWRQTRAHQSTCTGCLPSVGREAETGDVPLPSQYERVKQGDQEERPCQALLWRRGKDQKRKNLLQGRSLWTCPFVGPPEGVGTPTVMQLWGGNDIVTFIWLDVL